jgi:hypothetical protein
MVFSGGPVPFKRVRIPSSIGRVCEPCQPTASGLQLQRLDRPIPVQTRGPRTIPLGCNLSFKLSPRVSPQVSIRGCGAGLFFAPRRRYGGNCARRRRHLRGRRRTAGRALLAHVRSRRAAHLGRGRCDPGSYSVTVSIQGCGAGLFFFGQRSGPNHAPPATETALISPKVTSAALCARNT